LLYGFADEMETINVDVIVSLLKDLNFSSPPVREPAELKTKENYQKNIDGMTATPHPNKDDESYKILKKGLVMVIKKLDRLDIKVDLLRKDFLNITPGAVRTDRHAYGDFDNELAKVKSEYKILKAKMQRMKQLDGEAANQERNKDNVDREDTAERQQKKNKIFKLEK
jgi:hypothetical protein